MILLRNQDSNHLSKVHERSLQYAFLYMKGRGCVNTDFGSRIWPSQGLIRRFSGGTCFDRQTKNGWFISQERLNNNCTENRNEKTDKESCYPYSTHIYSFK